MTSDIRLARRRLYRAPAFALATVLTFAIGIGWTTLVFSVVDTLWLRPIPFANPDRLVTLDPPVFGREVFEQVRRSDAYEAVAAYTERAANLQAGLSTERALVARMTETCLATLGVRPIVGRAFTAQEYQTASEPVVPFTSQDVAGSSKVVMVNEVCARRYWGGTAHAIGKWIAPGSGTPSQGEAGTSAYTVIGVVASTREYGILAPETPEVYWALRQSATIASHDSITQMTLLLGARHGHAGALVESLRAVLRSPDR
jgi:hypothetical protein